VALVKGSSRPQLDRTLTSTLRVRSWASATPLAQASPGAHAAVELAVVNQGEVRYRVGQKTLLAHAGQAVLVPPGVEHVTTSVTALSAVSIHLSPDILHQVADATPSSETRALLDPVVLLDARRLGRLLDLLVDEAGMTDPSAGLAINALMEATSVEMLRRIPSDDTAARGLRPDARIAAALERIRTGYREPLHVDELAHAAGMSRFHFSRAFARVTGRSPYQYLQDTRLAAATAMLHRGHVSVTEAALSAGFGDLGRFGRLFKKTHGVTPSQMQVRT
jgi:AraC family transcriptional regulator